VCVCVCVCDVKQHPTQTHPRSHHIQTGNSSGQPQTTHPPPHTGHTHRERESERGRETHTLTHTLTHSHTLTHTTTTTTTHTAAFLDQPLSEGTWTLTVSHPAGDNGHDSAFPPDTLTNRPYDLRVEVRAFAGGDGDGDDGKGVSCVSSVLCVCVLCVCVLCVSCVYSVCLFVLCVLCPVSCVCVCPVCVSKAEEYVCGVCVAARLWSPRLMCASTHNPPHHTTPHQTTQHHTTQHNRRARGRLPCG